MNDAEILKWAAGAPLDLTQIKSVDEEALLRLLKLHRLETRFSERVKKEKPAWCSRPLYLEAWTRSREARANLTRRLQALREVSAAVVKRGLPLITVKGFSTYAITGDVRSIYQSNDLDVFYGDLEYFWQTLESNGYRGEKRLDHEYGRMSKPGVSIDLHRYFPVYAYPEGATATDLRPARSPGCWLQPFSPRTETEITYKDLRQNSFPSSVDETEGFLVPTPAMAVLILCAHEFRDYIEAPTRRSILKLSVLANIRDLALHARFDRRRFAALVTRFNGHDAVAFVGHLLQTYFGANPLPAMLDRYEQCRRSGSPQVLTHYGCWASLGSDDLLYASDDRPRALDTGRVVDRLGGNTVVASTGGPRKCYSVFAKGQGETIHRVVIQTKGEGKFPFVFSFQWSPDDLLFDILLLGPLEKPCEYQVTLQTLPIHRYPDQLELAYARDFGVIEHVFVDQLGEHIRRTGQSDFSASHRPEGWTLSLSLPWRLLPAYFRQASTLPMMLFLAKRKMGQKSPFWGADPVISVPLCIIPE